MTSKVQWHFSSSLPTRADVKASSRKTGRPIPKFEVNSKMLKGDTSPNGQLEQLMVAKGSPAR